MSDFVKKNPVVSIILILVIVVLLGAFFKNDKSIISNEKVSPSPSVSVAPVPTTGSRGTQKPSSGGSSTYEQLLVEYEGRRIQFDVSCQAIPGNTTYKNGTSIMFDNRSGDPRIITIDNVQYSFPGYGYKIVTLSSKTLPHTVLLSCGAAVNVGVINIQR